jgi:hypothetical protein
MAINRQQVQDAIANAKFPDAARQTAEGIIWSGLELYREYKSPKYASHTGKLVKKPQAGHRTSIGRYDQTEARTILISALCRAWLHKGVGNPTLNHKNDRMSEFHHFAQEVMGREGIGKIQQHLEKYWSTRAKEWGENEKRRLSGGSD